MTFTLTLGWWLAPLLVTVASFGTLFWQMSKPEHNRGFIPTGFFVFMGGLNLYVAYNYSTQLWVNFKLFGGMGLMLLFVLVQALFLARHVEDKQ